MWFPNMLLAVLGGFLIRGEIRQHTTLTLPWQRKRATVDGDLGTWSALTTEEIDHMAEGQHPSDETREDSDSPSSGGGL